MEPSIAFRIGINLIAFAVNLSCDLFIILYIIPKIIFIDKIITSVVWRIYIDHLSILMCLIVGIIGSLIVIYAVGYMHGYHHYLHKRV